MCLFILLFFFSIFLVFFNYQKLWKQNCNKNINSSSKLAQILNRKNVRERAIKTWFQILIVVTATTRTTLYKNREENNLYFYCWLAALFTHIYLYLNNNVVNICLWVFLLLLLHFFRLLRLFCTLRAMMTSNKQTKQNKNT